MQDADITVVVQGPVQSMPGRQQDEGITERCLKSVRQFLPGARSVLSTWENQDLAGLDYDELVINVDPGTNIIGYRRNGEPRYENTNRQIVSTMGGLRRVETRYAMKLRADNYLTGRGFLELQRQYGKRRDELCILKERVVITNTLMRRYYRGRRVAFFLSDFFDFGLTEDVMNIWDLPLLEDFPFDPDLQGARQHRGAPAPPPDVDQVLAERFINKHREEPLGLVDIFDRSGGKLRQSDVFFANNFVVATPDEIGLGLPLKFTEGRQAKFSSKATCLASPEWRRLYRQFCDPAFDASGGAALLARIWMMRLLFVPLKWLESSARSARDRRRYHRARREAKRGEGTAGSS